MGLSSKQVTGDGMDWSEDLLKSSDLEISIPAPQTKTQQQQQQKQPKVKCPRCDSANTKFCYYNNYSKLQPRHYCKACRRHWTNGGTLRNVPVGGGRKTKRPKTSHHQSTPTPITTIHSTNTNNSNNLLLLQQQQEVTMAFNGVLGQALLRPLTAEFPPTLPPADYSINNGSSGSFLEPLLSLPPVPQFTSTTAADMLIPYDTTTNPFSTEPLPCSFLNFTGQDQSDEEEITAISGSMITPWQQQVPTASSNTDVSVNVLNSSPSCFWSYWDDLVSPDLNHPTSSPLP